MKDRTKHQRENSRCQPEQVIRGKREYRFGVIGLNAQDLERVAAEMRQQQDKRQRRSEPERKQGKNTSVCTVSGSGVVVAVGTGTTVISVTTTDGGYVAVCVATVSDSSGIMTLEIDSLTGNEEIYNVQGKRMNALQRGLNIIRMSDGTTKNVIIK